MVLLHYIILLNCVLADHFILLVLSLIFCLYFHFQLFATFYFHPSSFRWTCNAFAILFYYTREISWTKSLTSFFLETFTWKQVTNFFFFSLIFMISWVLPNSSLIRYLDFIIYRRAHNLSGTLSLVFSGEFTVSGVERGGE